MKHFQQLKSFQITASDIRVIPSNIPWPVPIETIAFISNANLDTIEPFAFSSAVNLKKINLVGSGYNQDNITFKSNSFHTTSPLHKTLEYVGTNVVFEGNTFGNMEHPTV